MLIAGLACLVLAAYAGWWLLPALAFVLWLAHEAWLADHLFYSPRSDDLHQLAPDWTRVATVADGRLHVSDPLPPADTVVLEGRVEAGFSGRFFDPWLCLADRRFDFERGCHGRRFLALDASRLGESSGPIPLHPGHCRLAGEVRIHGFRQPDYAGKRLLIVAPHADDAELAAFGLYQRADDVMIVTLTQGETEAGHYEALGLGEAQAARLKGRLRSWDSMAIPLWGDVSQDHCLQMGYFCMQLQAMRAAPDTPQGSRLSGESDIRAARCWNSQTLPGDVDGKPTWRNLVADLSAILGQYSPEVVVLPHPVVDPHPDHVAAAAAVAEAVRDSQVRIAHYLLYANHLHDNDRWPMGPAGGGITLPPRHVAGPAERYWINPLGEEQQLAKAMALAMQHDLRPPLPFKKRLRRHIQCWLAGRRWPATGENEYFRKAVRAGELFAVTGSLDAVLPQLRS